MVELVHIPSGNIDQVWHKVENDITKALIRSGGYANSDHFKKHCKDGELQLLMLWDKNEPEDIKR